MSQVNDPSTDPWVAAEIDRALAPYVGRLAEAELAWMRAQLIETLATETAPGLLLSRARPRASVDESGEVERDPSARVESASKSPKAG